MDNQTTATIENSVKHWYLPLLLGIVFIIVGIWVFMTPLSSYIALTILFAAAFLVTGVIEIISAIANRNQMEGWGWRLTIGIIDLLVGLLLFSRPEITLAILPFVVGFAVMFRAISAIGWSIDLKRLGASDWGIVLLLGILGLILAFILLFNPVLAGMTVVFYTALSLIMVGVFQIYLSFSLRKLRNRAA